MSKLRNRIAIVLGDKDWVCLRVKNESEAIDIIARLSKHKGKLLLKTSMEPCPTLIDCDGITKAIYLAGEMSEETVDDVLNGKRP